jgi:hypothetical protein
MVLSQSTGTTSPLPCYNISRQMGKLKLMALTQKDDEYGKSSCKIMTNKRVHSFPTKKK